MEEGAGCRGQVRREKPGNIKQIGIKMIKTRLKGIWRQSLKGKVSRLSEFGGGRKAVCFLKVMVKDKHSEVCNHVLG